MSGKKMPALPEVIPNGGSWNRGCKGEGSVKIHGSSSSGRLFYSSPTQKKKLPHLHVIPWNGIPWHHTVTSGLSIMKSSPHLGLHVRPQKETKNVVSYIDTAQSVNLILVILTIAETCQNIGIHLKSLTSKTPFMV